MYRSGGRLDEYIDSTQVDNVLCRCAYNLLTHRSHPEKAVYLYQLAGRHCEVIDELCNQLSRCLIPTSKNDLFLSPQQRSNNSNTQREFWYSYCSSYLSSYFSGNGIISSSILRMINQTGSRGLLDSLETLLYMFPIFDGYNEGNFSQVLQQTKNIKLIPQSEDQIEIVAALRPHSSIKSIFDDFLVLVAESVSNLYKEAKSERGK
jgi:hypothetical protein